MARRDQPYLPLFVKDFLSDEKLNLCSAESTGVYIRLMCIMHMSDEYGTILLKQKYKQNSGFARSLLEVCYDFATQLSKQMPYSKDVIERALAELLDESVLKIEGDRLFQKRMVNDGKLSDSRALSGSKGGAKKAENAKSNNFATPFATPFANDFATAKSVANSEIVIVVDNTPVNESINENIGDVTTRARDEKLAMVMSHYSETIGSMPSPRICATIEGYLDHMDADVIINSIDIAADENKRAWSYVEGILKSRKSSGVRNMADVARKDEEWRSRKSEAAPQKNIYADLAEKAREDERKHGEVIEIDPI